MTTTTHLTLAAAAVTLTLAVTTASPPPAYGFQSSGQDTTVSFARDILPLFERSCWECHHCS